MWLYEKSSHLYGTTSQVPSVSDTQCSYKDADGNTLTLAKTDKLVDNSSDGIQAMKRLSDNKDVNVYVGDVLVIGAGIAEDDDEDTGEG